MPSVSRRKELWSRNEAQRPVLRYVIGLGVPIGIGISPWIANPQAPDWTSLLDPFPVSLRSILVPISAVLLGGIAVATQFYSRSHWSRSRLERIFGRLFLLFLLSMILLTVAYFLVVVRLPGDGGRSSVSFAVGFSQDSCCPCPAELSDMACAQQLNLKPSGLNHSRSDWKRKLTELWLSLLLLAAISLFAVLVGILLLDSRRVLRSK